MYDRDEMGEKKVYDRRDEMERRKCMTGGMN